MYQRLPDPPAQTADEPTGHYGVRLFAYVLEFSLVGCLTREQLRLAEYASLLATDSRGASTAYYDRIHEARVLLLRTIKAQDDAQAEAEQLAALRATVAGRGQEATNAGPMAALQPKPITRPPAGNAAHVQF